MTTRPAIATWSLKDVLTNTQINSLQAYCLDSPSLGIYSNNYTTSNTFSGNVTLGTAHSQTNKLQILSMNSVSDMINLSSPVDGQIVCLSDTGGTIGFPNEFFRYDAYDTITETYSPLYLTNTSYEYYSAKPTGVAVGSPGCWKLLNYPIIPKISYFSTTANLTSNTFGTASNPLPIYTSWSTSVAGNFGLYSILTYNTGLPNNFIFTTNKATATSSNYSIIPKATNYYICDVEYSFPIVLNAATGFSGTINSNNYLFATLYAINNPGTSTIYYTGGVGASSLNISNTGSWTTCAQPWGSSIVSSTSSLVFSNLPQYVYLKKRIIVQSAIGQDDLISFAMGLAGNGNYLYASMSGSSGYYQSATITIQAY